MRILIVCVISLLGVLIPYIDGFGGMAGHGQGGYSGIGSYIGLVVFVFIFYMMIQILQKLRDDDDKGHGSGYGKGHDTGYDHGHNTGYAQGHDGGYAQGYISRNGKGNGGEDFAYMQYLY